MTPPYLTEADVAATDAFDAVIDAVRASFASLAAGRVSNLPRRRLRGGGAMLHSMAAIDEDLGLAAYKNYVTRRDGARFVVGLHDLATAKPVAFLEADLLGRWRTGAATAVAAERLARTDARTLALIGSGGQAETQLAALLRVRDFERVLVYSRDAGRRRAFCEENPGPLEPAGSADEAVAAADVVVTVTTSKTPVFDGHRLRPGTLVAAVGSNSPSRVEVDAETVRRADLVVCDSVEACRQEAGELIAASEAGAFRWADAIDLAALPVGPPRADDRIVLFDSVGLAGEDLAAAAAVLKIAGVR